MASPRDYMSDIRRYYLPKAGVRARDAWHRAAGRHVQSARGGFSNWRNRKAWERGRRDVPARVGDQVRSRTPVVRGRINRATGRPHRDDRSMGQASDRTLSRLAEQQRRLRAAEARNRAARVRGSRLWASGSPVSGTGGTAVTSPPLRVTPGRLAPRKALPSASTSPGRSSARRPGHAPRGSVPVAAGTRLCVRTSRPAGRGRHPAPAAPDPREPEGEHDDRG